MHCWGTVCGLLCLVFLLSMTGLARVPILSLAVPHVANEIGDVLRCLGASVMWLEPDNAGLSVCLLK